MNEFELIARFFTRPPRAASVHLAVGDDAALLAPSPGCELAVSVDMLVGGRHFFADTDPETLGHKTLAVNLSDMAAMGATPRVGAARRRAARTTIPRGSRAFARGFYALADAHGVDLVGGDTTRGPLNLCVTIIGEVPAGQALLRSGAQAGRRRLRVGRARRRRARGGGDGRPHASSTPTRSPRRARGSKRRCRASRSALALRGVATAAIDVSDGLVGDLGHILERSAVGATVELAAIPRSPALARLAGGDERALALECLLAGGDDYELCFTAPRAAADRVAAIAASTAVPLTRIGAITEAPASSSATSAACRCPRCRAPTIISPERVRSMHNFDHRRCPACGELGDRRRAALRRRLVLHPLPELPRASCACDPQHGQRWILLAALALIGAAAIAGAAVTDHRSRSSGTRSSRSCCVLFFVGDDRRCGSPSRSLLFRLFDIAEAAADPAARRGDEERLRRDARRPRRRRLHARSCSRCGQRAVLG